MTEHSQDEKRVKPEPDEIALVGAGCLYAGATDTAAFWQTVMDQRSTLAPMSSERLQSPNFLRTVDRPEGCLSTARGGFLPSRIPFDAAKHGIMPTALVGAEPDQFLVLEVVEQALAMGRIDKKGDHRQTTAVYIGKGAYPGVGAANLAQHTTAMAQTMSLIQALFPRVAAEDLAELQQAMTRQLDPLNPDSVASSITNLAAGRLSNRLGFMGPHYLIDAACASSLIAVEQGVNELQAGRADMVIAGGSHVCSNVPFLTIFTQLNALSASERLLPFGDEADGTLPGEGVGLVVLKRRRDAERDGNRILALVKGCGSAGDGRGRGVATPNPNGEALAMRRAYQRAGVAPSTIGLLEGHGTATPVGDTVELEALHEVFGRAQSGPHIALGSAKANFGHCFPAAGAAGLIKAALALYHRVLPAQPAGAGAHPALLADDTPFYLNEQARPWFAPADGLPRRAAVNAFGFGGINSHVILEEYPCEDEAVLTRFDGVWPAELLVFQADSLSTLAQQVETARLALTAGTDLRAVAFDGYQEKASATFRLALVAEDGGTAAEQLQQVGALLARGQTPKHGQYDGVFFGGGRRPGKLSWLFPGVGAAYPGMLRDIAIHFPETRQAFDLCVDYYRTDDRPDLAALVFPRPARDEDEAAAQKAALFDVDHAAALAAVANAAYLILLHRFGLEPDMVLGHSSGGLTAALAAGMLREDLTELSLLVMRLMRDYQAGRRKGDIPRMAVLLSYLAPHKAQDMAARFGEGCFVSMENSPEHVVFTVVAEKAEAFCSQLREQGIWFQRLGFEDPFHTPYSRAPFADLDYDQIDMQKPRLPVYSCTTGDLLDGDAPPLSRQVANQLFDPVRFHAAIESQVRDGARVFLEVGPSGHLSPFVRACLGDRDGVVLSMDRPNQPDLIQLQMVLAQLFVLGFAPDLTRLAQGRMLPASAQPPARTFVDLNMKAVRLPDDFLRDWVRRHDGAASQQARAPFVDSITRGSDGESLRVLRRLDLQRDLFLLDHQFGAFGGRPEAPVRGLPLVPFTVSLEMMAEAAACLFEPGAVLLRATQARAIKWVQVEASVQIEMTAQRQAPDRALVTLAYADQPGRILAEAVLHFGRAGAGFAPATGPVWRLEAQSMQEPREQAAETYASRKLFHGPAFRNLVHYHGMSHEGIEGLIRVLPRDGLLAETPTPAFCMDPVLLDGLGQLLGVWSDANLPDARHIYPVLLEDVAFHAPLLPAGTLLRLCVQVTAVDERALTADMWLFYEEGAEAGRLVLSAKGWRAWRFDPPPSIASFWRFPQNLVAEVLARQGSRPPFAASLVTYRHPGAKLMTLGENVHAFTVLNDRERTLYLQAQQHEPILQQRRRLALQTVAKDAFRAAWTSENHDLLPMELDVRFVAGDRAWVGPTDHAAQRFARACACAQDGDQVWALTAADAVPGLACAPRTTSVDPWSAAVAAANQALCWAESAAVNWRRGAVDPGGAWVALNGEGPHGLLSLRVQLVQTETHLLAVALLPDPAYLVPEKQGSAVAGV